MKIKFSSLLAVLLAFFLLFSVVTAGCDYKVAQTPVAEKQTSVQKKAKESELTEQELRREFQVSPDLKLTQKQLDSLRLIKKAKEYAKNELGYKATGNFLRIDKGIEYIFVSYFLKTDWPFSYMDYRWHEINKSKDDDSSQADEIANLAKLGITPDKYEIDIYYPGAIAGGTPISFSMLDASPQRLLYLVFHEDWHDNVHQPIHIEEGFGDFIGNVAEMMFLGYSQERMQEVINKKLKCAKAVNQCHSEVLKLSARFQSKEITFEKYLAERDKLVVTAGKSQNYYSRFSAAEIVWSHTYTYYYPLAYRLYLAFDRDLVKMIQFLQEIDKLEGMNEPLYLRGLEKLYFSESRKAEKRIEAYIGKKIKELLAKKEPLLNKK